MPPVDGSNCTTMPQTPSSAGPRKKRRPLRWLQIVLGTALIAALAFWDDHGIRAARLLADTQLQFVATLLLISFLMNWLSAVKWYLLLRARGADVSLGYLTELYLIGKFFSNFAPSMVGGDVTRILLLGRSIGSHSQSAASVFLERFTGILALAVLAGLAVLWRPGSLDAEVIQAIVLTIAACCVAALALIYMPRTQRRLAQIGLSIPGLRRIVPQLDSLYGEVVFFRDRYRVLANTLLLSAAFYALGGVSLYTACLAIGVIPTAADVAAATPVIYLASSIPVSPNNIGWWEWCVGLLLQPGGPQVAQGIAAGLLIRAVSLVVSLLGGLLFLRHRHTAPAQAS